MTATPIVSAVTHKTCCTCKIEKPREGFYCNKTAKDGLASQCKPCHASISAKSRAIRRAVKVAAKDDYIVRAKQHGKECFRCKVMQAVSCFSKDAAKPDGMRSICKECVRLEKEAARGLSIRRRTVIPLMERAAYKIESKRRHRAKEAELAGRVLIPKGKNRVVLHDSHAASRLKYLEKARREAKGLHDAHVRCFKSDNSRYFRWKYAHDPKYAMYHRLKRWMHKHLKDKLPSKKWTHFLGYTPQELATHLEKQFTKGMGWHNKGAWHIDHICAVSSFDIASVDSQEFRDCFGLANLRPLWAKENLEKSAKWEFLI